MKYLVIIEQGMTSWGAYVPDLPGCGAAAESRDEVVELIREAIDFHSKVMLEHGESIPPALSEGELVEMKMAA